jgi:hypothetical protein
MLLYELLSLGKLMEICSNAAPSLVKDLFVTFFMKGGTRFP